MSSSSLEKGREVLRVNVVLQCDHVCENCEMFFDCKDPMKWKIYRRRRMGKALQKMKDIKNIVAVSGGKGGVGKSMVTVNLATAFAMKGYSVGILDQDLDGSTIPKMLGVQGIKKLMMGEKGILPAEVLGMKIISLALVYPDEVITLFHEMRRGVTEQFIANADWGSLDYLFIDLPPGTSSDACNLLQYIPNIDGTVTVTAPSEVSLLAARRATLLSAKAGCRVLGIIENMSGYYCECGEKIDFLLTGGGEKLAKELGVPLLGRIPFDETASKCGDEGVPFVYKCPDSPASKSVMEIADKLKQILEDLKKEKG